MIGIAVNNAISNPKGIGLVFIDSLSSLLLYNPTDVVLRFIHFLTGKIRSNNMGAIILLLSKDYGDTTTRIASFVDEVVELS